MLINQWLGPPNRPIQQIKLHLTSWQYPLINYLVKDNDFEEHIEKNEEVQSEIETKKENNFLSELSSKIGGGGGSVKSKKKDQEKIIEEDNKSIKSDISSKSIKSNVSKSLFDSDSDDDLFTSRWAMLLFSFLCYLSLQKTSILLIYLSVITFDSLNISTDNPQFNPSWLLSMVSQILLG